MVQLKGDGRYLLPLLLLMLALTTGCYPVIVPPQEISVVDWQTDAKVPGAIVRARYYEWGCFGSFETYNRKICDYYMVTDKDGKAHLGREIIFVGPFGHWERLMVEVWHPCYDDRMAFVPTDTGFRDAVTVTFKVTSLDKFLTDRKVPSSWSPGLGYYRIGKDHGLVLPVTLAETTDYWRSLAARHPQYADAIERSIATSGDVMRSMEGK